MDFPGQLSELTPRICDCEYCKQYPSTVISHPRLRVKFKGGDVEVRTNGARLANFNYCTKCKILLAVTSIIDAQVLGAVNSELFRDVSIFGAPKRIQPYLLSDEQKIERWGQLWGMVSGV